MENKPSKNEQGSLQTFADAFYDKVNFMFQRRGMLDPAGESRIELSPDEIAFVASAFTDNFIDTPDMIEISMLHPSTDGIDMTDDRGVMVITQHEDYDSIYGYLYTICAYSKVSGMFVTKDVRQSPKDYQAPERGDSKTITLHDDAPLDESERAALMAMISKL